MYFQPGCPAAIEARRNADVLCSMTALKIRQMNDTMLHVHPLLACELTSSAGAAPCCLFRDATFSSNNVRACDSCNSVLILSSSAVVWTSCDCRLRARACMHGCRVWGKENLGVAVSSHMLTHFTFWRSRLRFCDSRLLFSLI